MYKLSEREVGKLIEAFEEWDVNKDGKISKREIEAQVKRMGESNISDFVTDMMDTLDEDGNGEITLQEFLYVTT